jgi:hypothetical protein
MLIVVAIAKHVAKEHCCALGWKFLVRDLTISYYGHVLQIKKSNKSLGDNDKKASLSKQRALNG